MTVVAVLLSFVPALPTSAAPAPGPGDGRSSVASGYLSDPQSTPAESPGGAWNHIQLTRADPYGSYSSWVGDFHVQYNYGTHRLMWSTRLAPSVIIAFHNEVVIQIYDVWVQTRGIKFSDRHDDELPSYLFHSSLSSYKYDGKGISLLPMPGQWFEVELIALNNWGIVGMKESISLGR